MNRLDAIVTGIGFSGPRLEKRPDPKVKGIGKALLGLELQLRFPHQYANMGKGNASMLISSMLIWKVPHSD